MADVTKDRHLYIGGSDAYKIVKGDWLTLYEEKLGIREREDLSDKFNVQLGIYTEPFHLEWLRDKQGYDLKIDKSGFSYITTEGGFPLRVHPDALAPDDGENIFYPVEVKHTNQFATLDDLVVWYAPQLHLQMFATGTDKALFSYIGGNNEPSAHWIGKDQAYLDNLLNMCRAFWWHIEAQEPPTEGDVLSIDAAKPSIDSFIPYDFNGNNEWASFAADYTDNKASWALFETAKKELKKLVPDDASQVEGHGVLIKRSKSGSLLFK